MSVSLCYSLHRINHLNNKIDRHASYVDRAVSFSLVGAAAATASALLPVVGAIEPRTSTLPPVETETDAKSERGSATESECDVKIGCAIEPEADIESEGETKTSSARAAADVSVRDADWEATTLRSFLVDAEDRVDAFAELLTLAEARIAPLEAENEELTSAFRDAADVADAHSKKIKQLEAVLATMRACDVETTRALYAAKATIKDQAGKTNTLEWHVQELEAGHDDLWRDVVRWREVSRQAEMDRKLAEVKLGGQLAVLESVRSDKAEWTEEVWRLEQRVRELELQLSMKESARETTAKASKMVEGPGRRSAAVVPLPLLQCAEASARRNAPQATSSADSARSSESEATGQAKPQRKRELVSTKRATAVPPARPQPKTKTLTQSGRVGGAATTGTGCEAASTAAVKPAWR